MNPADLPSQGCSIDTLISQRWHDGPSWLEQGERLWPTCEAMVNKEVINSESKKTIVTLAVTENSEFDYLANVSSFEKIVRITAWIRCFIQNCKKSDVVLIESTAKRVNWPHGKVVKLSEEKDGVVRLAKIRIKDGDLLRPIQRLYLSEACSPMDEDLRQQIEGQTICDKRDESNISSDSPSLVPDSGEGRPPTSVPQRVNRYGRTLLAPRRLDLQNISFLSVEFQYCGTQSGEYVPKQLNSTRIF
ncbi:uncharacterized protein NPIL_608471 [Nephila pilipes]|uniref:DUF5641 domain-containing protein n=1 Tax=Nephila pilipes TaxID=299642 RepID=A0A8X6MMI4_NEPPI|nr:uncharacterized protein NPIL_608471 [Nephila pilipes]